ncbi:MAG: hypothetical protein ABFR62_02210 [Bacteroidota bacterium]
MDFISNHSNWALITLILLLITIINAVIGILMKRDFGFIDKKLSLYSLIAVYIQIILGLVSYMISKITQSAMQDFGSAMKDTTLRLFAVEHPLMMIIGSLLITIGFIKAKKATADTTKFNKILVFYILGFILILSRIPWSEWAQH